MFRLILVPLDGTPFAEQAVPPAIGLAVPGRASLLLAHVRINVQPLLGTVDPLDAAYVPLPDELDVAAREYLLDAARRIAERYMVPVEWVVLDGDVPSALRRLAIERAVDLIVMTSHDRSALGRLLLGSVAESVVREVRLPTLLLRKSERQLEQEREVDPETASDPIRVPPEPFRHVLVPLDGSPLAEAVLEPAERLARTSSAAITLLTVRHPAPTADDAYAGAPREYLERVAQSLRADGLTADVHEITDTHVAPAIVEAAADVGADVIAMTTHGRRTLAGLLKGSVAFDVVHSVLMPVLLIRPNLGDRE